MSGGFVKAIVIASRRRAFVIAHTNRTRIHKQNIAFLHLAHWQQFFVLNKTTCKAV